MKLLGIAFILVLAVSFETAYTDEFTDAMIAYEMDNYAAAFKGFKKLAEQGNAQAQYRVAIMYILQQGTAGAPPEDSEKWMRKAAEQGLADAQHELSRIYYGEEVVKLWSEKELFNVMLEEAIEWGRKSAEQGHYEAQAHLVIMLADNLPPDDYIEAFAWNELAIKTTQDNAATTSSPYSTEFLERSRDFLLQ